jgi:hypothetical protein
MKLFLGQIFCFFSIISFLGCSNDKSTRFRIVPEDESGIHFVNTIKETVEFNIFNYMYFYNGGGVAAGDVNGDGLADLYFTANQTSNKLYLNKGNLKFDDVTKTAGVDGYDGWTTGVTMADVNGDGRLDIYVCYLGNHLIYKGRNQLFINEGNDSTGVPVFRDEAMDYGLDIVGFSTQSAFFDYDRDGDLDMFMLNHSLHQNGTFGKSSMRKVKHDLAGDKLLRNENGRFVDVSDSSGIYSSVIGYGLGIVVSDINLDGWPDIYVGNDFHENDYLYINQQDGTFKEVLEKSMTHTARYTMGVDFADMNNDAFPDLISMDMLPDDPLILKSAQAEDPFDVYNFKIGFGFNHQFARNNLQLNNQDGTFSEIGLMAGVQATDWSWSSLFADFDLDGYKDIFVANGILRRSNDLDYINFITVDSVQMKIQNELSVRELSYFEKMPKIKLANYLFINNRDSTFTNKAPEWGIDNRSYANGAAYADLDNDGDLDIITNNIEDPASIYENRTITKTNTETAPRNYLRVSLKGSDLNLFGIGTKVFLYNGGKVQVQECMPTRGYQSSVDYTLVFGAGDVAHVDSLVVVWPRAAFQRINDVKVNSTIVLEESKASGVFDYARLTTKRKIFERSTDQLDLNYTHIENKFVEFNREGLIPHMLSSEGPACAVADVNGDGRDDIFLGGAKWKTSMLFIQNPSGKFSALLQRDFKADSTYEDVDAQFFDADSDRDMDLVVISGGNEYSGKSAYRKPRLYVNDGKGSFSKSTGMPEIFLTGSCVAVSDIDNDGDQDMFIGGRSIPWRYGIPADSYILVNDGHGGFSDETKAIAPGLANFGFVKDAIWIDIDNDKRKDLVIAAEWSPVRVFLQDAHHVKFAESAIEGLNDSNGWWNVLLPFDMDNDGDTDIVAGNLGLNSKLKATTEQPVSMYVSDFDKNDSTDQIIAHYIQGKQYPFATRDELTKQMPFLKKRFLSYHKFAKSTLLDIFPEDLLETGKRYDAYQFQSVVFENVGSKFILRPLPRAAQISTVNAITAGDFNGDGISDLVIAGNFYPVNVQLGRNDGSYGLLLEGTRSKKFVEVPATISGLSITGEVRHLMPVSVNGKIHYLAVRNNDKVESFTKK